MTELEHLRRLELGGTTPAEVFFQLKEIFHFLESLGSARIEGNHTTLADMVESRLTPSASGLSDHFREMVNIEEAMAYIEANFAPGQNITAHFLRELHDITVKGLIREGDQTPGAYRQGSVQISQSAHLPPDAIQVPQYVSEMIDFLNRADSPKYHLIKVALAHHRFAWIHPFTNGNGRVVRLLTYALLIKYGFNVKVGGRVLNPTAIFCNDRDAYYTMLGKADEGTEIGREAWCQYVLEGMLGELKKLDRLGDAIFLNEKILIPAMRYARERELITALEEKILLATARQGVVKVDSFPHTMSELNATQRSYQIKKLVERKMLVPIAKGSRRYMIGFSNSLLIRGVIKSLSAEGFISESLAGKS